MSFSLTVIGSGSGAPLPGRFTSAQVLNVHERFVLIDCGEGTQINLRRFGINFNRIELILISHLHGDHYLGLPGLLNTFHLLGRKKELHIVGHHKLKELLDYNFGMAGFVPKYPIHFHDIDDMKPGENIDFDDFSVKVFPLKHRIPASGFRITEKPRQEKIKKDFIEKYSPDYDQIHAILRSEPFFDASGKEVPRDEIVMQPALPRSFAYVSDTVFDRSMIPFIQGADLLYHETTYDKSLQNSAAEKMHATSVDAATIAVEAGVKKLLIGHFSSRYRTPELLLEEARKIFPETVAAEDGLIINLSN
ncbi:MAG: ribonuclease Z [Bacteroidetes bacterium GWF2_43_63]|nr:MAG: ribonuclease Z [Bacteroidetes bacterium GWE2_42_42]OFY54255.1 MAG: ribonuclease Z [Bacteroidetes bacterium GWF2_43_63]HBG69351.1 ribonuclease Z [Bacteroidales bacterium]HCB60404.1 ribonuclease Z [Bacteroidales bacterium]HCY23609.1 ribonuclease Z [Bacteroidales bacterium]